MRLEGEIAGVPLAVAAIVSTPDRELMIISLERMRLQVRDMQTGELLHDEIVDRPRGFLYRFFVPMEDGDTVVAIGSYAGEMKDSLVALSLRRLLVEEGYLPRAVSRPAMTDYAYRLAAGPCGPSAAIFYRDPEDDEQMDDEDSADSNRLDIHGVCGLYVRRLADRAVLETVPIDAAVPSGAALAGTDHHVVVAIREGALIVPRSRAPATLLPGRPLAVDTRTPQCVLASDDGALRLLTVS
jgi:hypothetical protein